MDNTGVDKESTKLPASFRRLYSARFKDACSSSGVIPGSPAAKRFRRCAVRGWRRWIFAQSSGFTSELSGRHALSSQPRLRFAAPNELTTPIVRRLTNMLVWLQRANRVRSIVVQSNIARALCSERGALCLERSRRFRIFSPLRPAHRGGKACARVRRKDQPCDAIVRFHTMGFQRYDPFNVDHGAA